MQGIVQRVVHALTADEAACTAGQRVSDCALFAPRTTSTFNKSHRSFRVANEIAKKMYLDTGLAKCPVGAYMLYARMVSAVCKRCIAQYEAAAAEAEHCKAQQAAQHERSTWCVLKKRPPTVAVMEPEAMPVQVSPQDEIQPFLQYLHSNKAPVENKAAEHCMLFKRGALYSDGRMDLCKQVVGPTWIQGLMDALTHNTHVQHFLLGNNVIGPTGGRAIGHFLQQPHTPRIKTWYLAGNDLDHEGMQCIADGLMQDSDCTQLWLKRNPLKVQGAEHVGRLLAHNGSVRVLDLHNTALFDDGLRAVVQGLRENDALEVLYLDANGVTEDGAACLAEYFEELTARGTRGVHSLYVGMNNLGDAGVTKLVRALAGYPHLQRLGLDSTAMSEVGAAEVCAAFKEHPNLIMLGLGMYKSTNDMGCTVNNMGDAGLQALLPLLHHNRTLQCLSVMMNGISQDGIAQLADALDSNATLMYLDCAQYGLKLEPQLHARIKGKLAANRAAAGFTTPQRHIKHTADIQWIDSIYRNASGKRAPVADTPV